MGYDCGTAAGLMAGAFTESTVIGTAGDAIGRLPLPEAEKDAAAEQHPRRVRRQLPGGHRLRRVVPLEPRAEAARLRSARGGRRRSRPRWPAGRRSRTRRRYQEWDRRAYRVSGRAADARRDIEAVLRAGAGVRRARPPRRHVRADPGRTRCCDEGDVVARGGTAERARRRAAPCSATRWRTRRCSTVPHGDRGRRDHEPRRCRPLARRPRRAARPRHRARAAGARRRGDAVQRRDRRESRRPAARRRHPGRRRARRRARSATSSARRARPDVVFVGLGILVGGFLGLLTVQRRRACRSA